ncbi:L-Aspartase-like protein [Podospora fimiseda]|uniref:L-Aspartase-like protein n=1 Tax=Podospora fimiseda TaxID=252190 RepID=A0AAN6YNV7_9PEZI|nr:L-Aspartase-like protein [Podospora fimiseda]
MGTEALDGTAQNYHLFISAIRSHPGQAEASSNILAFLSGSKISPNDESSNTRIGLTQDRYALRTAPQWIGPQLEDLQLATRQVSTELNSTTDNPLINTVNGHIHQGGNFQAMTITSAMEKTMTALQNLGRFIYAQCSEMINSMTNKGLPANLSVDDPSQSFTCTGSIQHTCAGCGDDKSMDQFYGARFGSKLEKVVPEWFEMVGGELEASQTQSAVELSHTLRIPLLQKWNQLFHVDLNDRCVTMAKETVGEMLKIIGFDGLTLEDIREYQHLVAAALKKVYSRMSAEFIRNQKTQST